MPFETSAPLSYEDRSSVAIIGGGISGMGAALALSQTHNVTLFETEPRLGGHARTKMAGPNRDIPVDTGFMVFNYKTYPYLTALFDELDVPVKPSDMSFAVSMDDGAFEYGLTSFKRLLGDKKNAVSPKFWRMISDILKFNAKAETLGLDPDRTLSDLLDELNMGEMFRSRYLYPLAGAIWSTAREDMSAFPAKSFVQFFSNHQLLSATQGPQWWTVDGGSMEYVSRLEKRLRQEDVELRLGTPVTAVGRSPAPWVQYAGGEKEQFDDILFACHSDQALKCLSDASQEEQRVLSALKYRPNKAFLHADTSHMPKRDACWSSWVYKGASTGNEQDGSFTYWMNSLQGISNETPVFVTLNPKSPVREDLIYDEAEFWHPQFDIAALRAQEELPSIQGLNKTWFCGAYARYGFHEDGLDSAMNTVRAMGAVTAWA